MGILLFMVKGGMEVVPSGGGCVGVQVKGSPWGELDDVRYLQVGLEFKQFDREPKYILNRRLGP